MKVRGRQLLDPLIDELGTLLFVLFGVWAMLGIVQKEKLSQLRPENGSNMRGKFSRALLCLFRQPTNDQAPDGSNQSPGGLVPYRFVGIATQTIQLTKARLHVLVQLCERLRAPRRRGNPLAISLAAHQVNRSVIKSTLQRLHTQNPRRRITLATSLLDDPQPLIKWRSNERHDGKQPRPYFRCIVSQTWLGLVTC